jgi:hypothetical protein
MRVTTSSPPLILGWFVSLWMIIDHTGSGNINRLCCDGSGALISPPASFFVNAVSRETLQTTVCMRIYIYIYELPLLSSRISLVLPIFLFDVISALFLDINDWKRSNA